MVTMMTTRILSSARGDNGWVLLKQGHDGALFLLHLLGQCLHLGSAFSDNKDDDDDGDDGNDDEVEECAF